MRLYDTLSGEVRPVPAPPEDPIRMYSCGPTVYRAAHLGNFRTFLLADLLVRTLEREGRTAHQVMNITDIGHLADDRLDRGPDRMLLAAEEEGKSPEDIARSYTEAFHTDRAALGIRSADVYPLASEHVPLMIALVERLLEGGHAYVARGNVYFDVTGFPDYGRLSGNRPERLRAGHRMQPDPVKHHPADFLLWRAAGPGRLQSFRSPWGEGFPGWHIECSAMSLHHLGERIELHTGGADLVFPHHEDEIAQSEGATGHQVVLHWAHGHHLLFGGRKMAKSTRNVWRVDDLRERGYDPLAFRLLCFTARYRRQLRFSWEALEAAQRSLVRLRQLVADTPGPSDGLGGAARSFDERFLQAVSDDFDFSRALTALWGLVEASDVPASEKVTLLLTWDQILGLDLRALADRLAPPAALELLELRGEARRRGDFAAADRIRSELASMGIAVLDGPEGTSWRWTR